MKRGPKKSSRSIWGVDKISFIFLGWVSIRRGTMSDCQVKNCERDLLTDSLELGWLTEAANSDREGD